MYIYEEYNSEDEFECTKFKNNITPIQFPALDSIYPLGLWLNKYSVIYEEQFNMNMDKEYINNNEEDIIDMRYASKEEIILYKIYKKINKEL